jgi:hypothetical protein
MIQAGHKYRVGEIEHVFPDLVVSGKFKYTAKAQSSHLRLIQILDEFDTACELQNIEYTIGGKTLLGAVLHEGFVPWEANAEVEILQSDAVQLENIYNQPSGWTLKKVPYGYQLTRTGTDNPYIAISLISYNQKYTFCDPQSRERYPLYVNEYSDVHPRRRYNFENIMLWGPQRGEELCQRLYGAKCFTHVRMVDRTSICHYIQDLFSLKMLEPPYAGPEDKHPEE